MGDLRKSVDHTPRDPDCQIVGTWIRIFSLETKYCDRIERRGPSSKPRRNPLHGCSETITAPRQGFYIYRRFGSVLQYLPQSLDGIVDTVVKVNKRIGRPNSFP